MRRMVLRSWTSLFRFTLVAGLALSTFGCGSSSNNDQGVAFTLLGYFTDNAATTGARLCNLETFSSVDSVPIASLDGETAGLTSFIKCIGVQNNLSGQFIRTQQARISYSIAGSTANPPSTSVPFTHILGPVGGAADGTGPGSSLPPGFTAPNKVVNFVALIPPEVKTWIALNRAQLPEPPFTMVVTVQVVGITSAGAQLETNDATLFVEVEPETIIPPSNDDDEEEEATDPAA